MPEIKRAMFALVTLAAVLSAHVCLAGTERKDADGNGKTSAAVARPASQPAVEPKEKAVTLDDLLAAVEQLKNRVVEQNRELEAQRAALRTQQERMEAMEREIHARGAANASPTAQREDPQKNAGELAILQGQLEAVADNQKELSKRVTQVQTDLSQAKSSTEGRLRSIGPFNFSGDVRLRYEGTWSGNATSASSGVPQHRERFRLRLNATAKFNDDISGGLSLASGDLNNPVSANQTLTTMYIRKPIGIDRAFVTYQPHAFKPLSITAGKFAYTWFRTEQMWDNDLNPEGISESLNWNWKDSFFQHFGVVALQSPINTSFSAGGTVLSPTPSSAMFSGQIQTNWRLSSRLKLAIHPGFYHFRNPDQIAQNQVGGSGPTTGALGGNNLTNYVGTVGTRRFFASKFDVFDLYTRLDADTGISRFPLAAIFNFDENTAACGNGAAFIAAGGAAPFCDPHQRHAYWGELQFGRTQEKGDFRFGYTFNRVERDAVLSGFNFDDKRQATNNVMHRLEIFYQAYRNITAGFTGIFGRQLQTPVSATASVPEERYLKRLQFDLFYKF